MRNIWKNIALPLMALVFVGAGVAYAADAPVEPPEPGATFADMKITAQDYSQGPADAKVTIIEYASLTCPHCAHLNNEILPELKKEYVKTGKVRYIYRDFPLDKLALVAAMVARCGKRDEYFGYIDTFFAAQMQWAGANNPVKALGNLARLGGMSEATFNSCLKDTSVQDAILKERLQAVNDFKVNATPTVFVNGASYSGGMSLEQFRTLLNWLLSKS